MAETTDYFTSATFETWTCPSGVTTVMVEVWGGGGGGGSGEYFNGNGGGGGSGSYSRKNAFSVTPSTGYTVYVGAGGAGGNGSDGNTGDHSYFNSTATVRAWGGGGGGYFNAGGYGGSGGALGTGDYREVGQTGNAYNGGAWGAYGAGGNGGEGFGFDNVGQGGYDGAVLITYDADPDTTAPTTPTLSSATTNSDTAITLSWTASTDNVAVTGYQTRINGGSWTNRGNILTYQYTGLTASTSYSFEVRAYDAASNYSGISNTQNATTYAAPDTTAPSTPVLTSATATSTTVIVMNWAASTDNVAVTGYQTRINGGSWSDRGNVLTYSYTGLTQSTSYTFEVRAYDAAGNYSGVSNLITTSTLTPAPPSSIFYIQYQ